MDNDRTKSLFTQDMSSDNIYSDIRCFGCMEIFSAEFELCPYCGYIVGTQPRLKCYLQPGLMLSGRYILGQVIGQGGFGITYIGYDQEENRKVAIKEFFPNALSTREAGSTDIICVSKKAEAYFENGVKKMLDEGERLSRFSGNPNVVNVYDYFEENGTAYIVMEYLEGKSLKEYIAEKGGRIDPVEAVQLILPILDALEEMHAENMIHRDIAPDNIYICNNGNLKLLDFGSARIAVEDAEKSLSVLVKPGYAPKEQYASRSKQGPWTDVYSVCATLYKMVTGEAPVESIERDVTELKPFEDFGIKGCYMLEEILEKGLEPDPENRIRSADELADELVSVLNYMQFTSKDEDEEEDEIPAEEEAMQAENESEEETEIESDSKWDALCVVFFSAMLLLWFLSFAFNPMLNIWFNIGSLASLGVLDYSWYKGNQVKSEASDEEKSYGGLVFVNIAAIIAILFSLFSRVW